ncbi:MAG: hypothetical protein ACTSVI_08245 [Promethearchaeota archaeon]
MLAIPWPLLVMVLIDQSLQIEKAVPVFYVIGCAITILGMVFSIFGGRKRKFRVFSITGLILNLYLLSLSGAYLLIFMIPLGMI